jgi:hypothetical protein
LGWQGSNKTSFRGELWMKNGISSRLDRCLAGSDQTAEDSFNDDSENLYGRIRCMVEQDFCFSGKFGNLILVRRPEIVLSEYIIYVYL